MKLKLDLEEYGYEVTSTKLNYQISYMGEVFAITNHEPLAYKYLIRDFYERMNKREITI